MAEATTCLRRMSGSWLQDENGEVEDVIFFVSPRYLRELAEE